MLVLFGFLSFIIFRIDPTCLFSGGCPELVGICCMFEAGMKGLALGSRISFLVDRMREYGGLVIVGGVVRLTEKARLPGWVFLLFYPCERFVVITNGGGFSEGDGRWN